MLEEGSGGAGEAASMYLGAEPQVVMMAACMLFEWKIDEILHSSEVETYARNIYSFGLQTLVLPSFSRNVRRVEGNLK